MKLSLSLCFMVLFWSGQLLSNQCNQSFSLKDFSSKLEASIKSKSSLYKEPANSVEWLHNNLLSINSSSPNKALEHYKELLELKRIKKLKKVYSRFPITNKLSEPNSSATKLNQWDVQVASILLNTKIGGKRSFLSSFVDYNIVKEVNEMQLQRVESLRIQRSILKNLKALNWTPKNSLRIKLLNYVRPAGHIGKLGLAYYVNKLLFDFSAKFGYGTMLPLYLPSFDFTSRAKFTEKAVDIYEQRGDQAFLDYMKANHQLRTNIQRAAVLPKRWLPLLMLYAILQYGPGLTEGIYNSGKNFYQDYKLNQLTEEAYLNNDFYKSIPKQYPLKSIDSLVEIHQLELSNLFQSFNANFVAHEHRSFDFANKEDLQRWKNYLVELDQNNIRIVSLADFAVYFEWKHKRVNDPYSREDMKEFRFFLNNVSDFRNLEPETSEIISDN